MLPRPDAYRRWCIGVGAPARWWIRVLVPTSDQAMQNGLQGFSRPRPDEGMLFVSQRWPNEETIPMWMATVNYPLDMIWIRRDGRVIAIERVRPGDRSTFEHRGIACLELASPTASELGIVAGSNMQIVESSCPPARAA